MSHSTPIARTGPPKSILIVKKRNDAAVAEAYSALVGHLQKKYPSVAIFHETTSDGVELWSDDHAPNIELVVTIGGDGTILHASSLFRTGPVPPVLSFSMGTLGFLLPFHINAFPQALEDVFRGRATVLPRMRLSCKFYDGAGYELDGCRPELGWQVMNEITLHRGRSPHLNIIDAFVDDQHLTEAVSDGLILSTPTGSTAYSLSSGGPIMHPAVQGLLITPICPRSLSFRSLILPGSSRVRLKINERSRSSAEVSMDGQEAGLLRPGDSVQVEASPYPIPCVNRSSVDKGGDDWVQDINDLLQFNVGFKNKNKLKHYA